MSVVVLVKVQADPAKFEQAANTQRSELDEISNRGRGLGLISHRFIYGTSTGEVAALDEWPDEQTFRSFFAQQEGPIRALLTAAGMTGEPTIEIWDVPKGSMPGTVA